MALMRVLPFAVILFILLFLIRKKKINPPDLNLNKPVSTSRFLIWTVGFLIFVLLIEFTFFHLGILEIDPWNHPLLSTIIRITGAVILAPVVEEIIFRGLILNVLTKRQINIHLAIFTQACFFVLLHNFTYENTLSSNIGIVQSFIDATLFGYARYHTKSLYTPITMHMTGNFIATVERFIF
jgi:membrane protease YdiL (CAAX protease family)